MDKKKQRAKYIVSDFIAASVAWALFNTLRYHEIAYYLGFDSLKSYLSFTRVWEGQLLVPFCWLILYYFTGYYNKPFGKSRIAEFFVTFTSVLIGGIVIFFVVVLDDLPHSFHIYYQLFFALIGLQFLFTYLPRLFITYNGVRNIKNKKWQTNVLIVGAGEKAEQISEDLEKQGFKIKGFVIDTDKPIVRIGADRLLGNIDNLFLILQTYPVKELIVAIDSEGMHSEILNKLYKYQLPIKIYGERLDYLPKIKTKNIYGYPLIDITDNQFSEAEKNIKYFLDKVLSAFFLLILSPLFIYIAIKIKKESSGPVFFKQQRIGFGGIPFTIYKFRTMCVDAEEKGPMLSSENDPRTTPFGKFLRKYRLDELPQFWNVLKGDMSLVGPRPERQYFIDLIVKKAPYYYLLMRLRPGVTSWGMVKYGYADSVDKMVERLEYDMLYYGHMSLLTDIKILLFTIKTVVTGKGI